ncbi:radical SAM protein [Caldicellulosiruptoraceae bacterium PP1]
MNQYAPKPIIMSIDVTYKCTMKCLHCFNGSNENNLETELTDSELMNISDQIVEIMPNVICFCGGEPLLRKEILYKCCEKIVTGCKGITQVNMVTNGELVDEEVANNLQKAGFSLIQVSLDGASSETHDWLRNKNGSFNKAINAIKCLLNAGLMVGVACTPSLKNINEIEEIIKLCEKMGVHDFRVQPLMIMGRAKRYLNEYIPSYNDYRWLARKLMELQMLNIAENKMHIEWGDPVDHLIRGNYRENGYNPFIGIDAYGYIRISPYLPITFGNIRKHKILDYWNSGLSNVWNLSIVKWISREIRSINDLNLSSKGFKEVYWEKSVDIDLIEEDISKIKIDKFLTNKY